VEEVLLLLLVYQQPYRVVMVIREEEEQQVYKILIRSNQNQAQVPHHVETMVVRLLTLTKKVVEAVEVLQLAVLLSLLVVMVL
jgi:hypothetical protein